jgi:hypothetical protein
MRLKRLQCDPVMCAERVGARSQTALSGNAVPDRSIRIIVRMDGYYELVGVKPILPSCSPR